MNKTWEEKYGGVDAGVAGVKALPRQTMRVLVHTCLQDDALFLREIVSVSSHSTQKELGSLKAFLDIQQGPL